MPGVKPPAAAADAPRALQHTLFSVRLQRRREKSSSKAKHGAALRSAVQTRLQDRCCWISRAGAREEGSRKPAVPGWRLCAPPSDQQGGARGAALCQPELPATAAVVDRATQTHDPVLLFFCARAPSVSCSPLFREREGVGGRRARGRPVTLARESESEIWLILPVVICLSQRLSHACLSMNHSYGETANGSLQQLSFTWSLDLILHG